MDNFFHEFIEVSPLEINDYIESLRGFTDSDGNPVIGKDFSKKTTRMVISTFAWIDTTFSQSWFTYSFYDKGNNLVARINSVDFQ